nr:restriction endonuclease [Moraxella sp.]
MNYLLIRTPQAVIKQDKVGYAWKKVNFSQYQSAKDVISAINNAYTDGIGRKAKSVKRFFDLNQGDIVVVPLTKSIAIGKVEGTKFYDESLAKDYACKLVRVNFFRDKQGNIVRIPRKDLNTNLETRLKIKTTIADLSDLKSEVEKVVQQLETGEAYVQDSYILQKQDEAITSFKQNLLKAITKGTVKLEAGGRGLELLIAELLKLEDYQASIQAKNAFLGIADVDIIAEKSDSFATHTLLIQVKHHIGTTDSHGIKQLIAFDDRGYENAKKILITTADISEESREMAESHDIQVINGEQLMDIIYQHIRKLSQKFKTQLGIIDIPMMVE